VIQTLIADAVAAGARQHHACQLLGVSARTLERWRAGATDDARHGPRPGSRRAPPNQLTNAERRAVLATVNAAEYRDLSPHQIVPRLADAGQYLASESTIYRLLRAAEQLTHRGRAKPAVRRPPRTHHATRPDQVWSWDITYLKTPVRGQFLYLYLVMDIWSRKIVGWAVHEEEAAEHAARLVREICRGHRLNPEGLVLHADNGGPMKGATMVATLERLGVLASFSRPGVSNDNPFSEALFRTLKYRPGYPAQPFADLGAARTWVAAFVRWYNHDHRHSAIRFVTPAERHAGRDDALLQHRQAVYQRARARTPARWSGTTRNWTPIAEVQLNPEHQPARQDARVA
jgi:transposase InsO family protein